MKKTTRFSFFIICLVLAWHNFGNAQHFSVSSLQGIHPVNKEYFSFPLITDRTDAARRINTWLHGTILETLPGKFNRSPFERIWPRKGSPQGVTMLNYLVYANNTRYISMDIIGKYSGTSLSSFSIIQNFDAKSGQPINLEDLFTRKGLQELQQLVIKQRTDRIDRFLASLDTTNRVAAEQYTIYSDCLSSIKNDKLKYDELLLTNSSLKIIRRRCASHTGAAYDDPGDFENEFDLSRLKPFLNNYGQYLLTASSEYNTKKEEKNMHIGLYQGKIDEQHAIHLFVEKIYDDGLVRAFCFYDNPARKIDLQALKHQDGSYEFREMGKNHRTTAGIFRLKPVSSFHLKGKWSMPDSSATHMIDLH